VFDKKERESEERKSEGEREGADKKKRKGVYEGGQFFRFRVRCAVFS
jgi:hypothetical protein